MAFTSDLYGHTQLPCISLEPVSENKIEFGRPMRYVEAMFDCPARHFHVAHQGSGI